MNIPSCYLDAQERPWWTYLPGMNWRTAQAMSEAEVSLVNRISSLACTARLMSTQNGDQKRREAAGQASDLREWLGKAVNAEEAYLRRLALCLVTDITPGGVSPRAVRDLAIPLVNH